MLESSKQSLFRKSQTRKLIVSEYITGPSSEVQAGVIEYIKYDSLKQNHECNSSSITEFCDSACRIRLGGRWGLIQLPLQLLSLTRHSRPREQVRKKADPKTCVSLKSAGFLTIPSSTSLFYQWFLYKRHILKITVATTRRHKVPTALREMHPQSQILFIERFQFFVDPTRVSSVMHAFALQFVTSENCVNIPSLINTQHPNLPCLSFYARAHSLQLRHEATTVVLVHPVLLCLVALRGRS